MKFSLQLHKSLSSTWSEDFKLSYLNYVFNAFSKWNGFLKRETLAAVNERHFEPLLAPLSLLTCVSECVRVCECLSVHQSVALDALAFVFNLTPSWASVCLRNFLYI